MIIPLLRRCHLLATTKLSKSKRSSTTTSCQKLTGSTFLLQYKKKTLPDCRSRQERETGKANAGSTPRGSLNRRRGDFSDRCQHRQSPGEQLFGEIIAPPTRTQTQHNSSHLRRPHRNRIANWSNSRQHGHKVETSGLEPPTPGLQSPCSPS